MKRHTVLVGCFVTSVATLLTWQLTTFAPLVWTSLMWTGLLTVLAVVLNRRRRLLLRIAAAVLAIGLVEGVLWVQLLVETAREAAVGRLLTDEGTARSQGFYDLTDPVLRFGPHPRTSARSIRKYAGKTIYSVRYTIDANRLRISPPVSQKTNGCILFFGDSFAFGSGVKDYETAAYQLGIKSGGLYKVYNFAFTEFSAHQMLAQIQSGTVRSVAHCERDKPVYAIYQFLPNNVIRLAVSIGPRYILSSGGTVERRGFLHEGRFFMGDRIYVNDAILRWFRWLDAVLLYQRVFGYMRDPDSTDFERFFSVVQESANSLDQEFHGVKFLAVLWDDFTQLSNRKYIAERTRLRDGLTSRKVEVRDARVALPKYEENPSAYYIEHELHPTAEAHSLLAAYLLKNFILADVVEKGSQEAY